MSSSSPPSSSNEIGILVMGLTGAGKSAFISRLTEQDIAIGHTLRSCTTKVNGYPYRRANGERIWLIDTPGFDDTNKANPTILREIVSFLCAFCEGENLTIGGLLYIHRITDIRMSGSSLASLRIFEALCGEACFGDVIVVTTMWDTLQTQAAKELAEEREVALQREEIFFGRLKRRGAGFRRSSDDEPSSSVVDAIADRRTSVTLAVQKELMLGPDVKLADTSAGRLLGGDLTAARQKLEKRLILIETSSEGSEDDVGMIADIREQMRLLEATAGDQEHLNVTYDELTRERQVSLELDTARNVGRADDTPKSAAEVKLEVEIAKLKQDNEKLQKGQKRLYRSTERELAQQHTQIQSLEDRLAQEKAQRDNKPRMSFGLFDFLLGRIAKASTLKTENTITIQEEIREPKPREARAPRISKALQQDRRGQDTTVRASAPQSGIDHTNSAVIVAPPSPPAKEVQSSEKDLVAARARPHPAEHTTQNGGFPANVIIDPSGIRRNYSSSSSQAIARNIPSYGEQQNNAQYWTHQYGA